MSAIVQFSRYKSNNHDEMVKAAKQAKAIYERHGAELFRVSRFHTGQWAGEWLAVSRYKNWSAYGKAMEGLAEDAEFQKLYAHVLSIAELTGRSISVGIDL